MKLIVTDTILFLQARSNITNTISLMKLLVGRKFKDQDVQVELSKSPFKAVELSNGGVGISILYNDEPLVISAEHAMAMMLVKAKDTSAKANGNLNIADSVLAVPQWFTESQRRGILQACEIASLNCLKVTNESCAIALSYGIFKSAKKLFSETEPQHVMFVDIGYTSYCVTIVDFIQVRIYLI
jgi:heat shock protein 4